MATVQIYEMAAILTEFNLEHWNFIRKNIQLLLLCVVACTLLLRFVRAVAGHELLEKKPSEEYLIVHD
jgi:hypothetical protein